MKRKINNIKKLRKRIAQFFASSFWFIFGFSFAGLLLISIVLVYFQIAYQDKIYQGIYVDNIYLGDRTREEARKIFEEKNNIIKKNKFQFSFEDTYATVSAERLNIGYNSSLLADQVFSIGRSGNVITNFYLILSSYLNGTYLVSSYTYSWDDLWDVIKPINERVYRESVDALFSVSNNRVVAFRQSSEGRVIDSESLANSLQSKISQLTKLENPEIVAIRIPIKIIEPEITTEKANDLGIVEVIGEGKSYFAHSIPNRIFNITLAASRINGILVAPKEVFSFNKAIGDISKFTGYKEAYVIKSGKTVLGDGGGVCQVSTTLFRAVLDAGLPIIERHAHTYRVAYYEQNFPPGLDATIYSPSIDFRFRNDTGKHILIQSFIDPTNTMLVFTFYGRKDGRESITTKPVVTSQTPPPPPLYQDDPTLALGAVKQVDYPAYGATVYFERIVKKDGKILFSDKFVSRYTPWQAVFLKGTKVN